MIVVSDTSPISTLINTGKVELLRRLYGDVLIPEAVCKELSRTHTVLPDFVRCEPVTNMAAVKLLMRELDAGEAEAIVLAKEKHADLLLVDEMSGRSVATREGLRFVGLVGVLLQAKAQGLIPSVSDVLEEIETNTTFYLSDEMKNLARQRAGER